jgi:hypothetical protein
MKFLTGDNYFRKNTEIFQDYQKFRLGQTSGSPGAIMNKDGV